MKCEQKLQKRHSYACGRLDPKCGETMEKEVKQIYIGINVSKTFIPQKKTGVFGHFGLKLSYVFFFLVYLFIP